MHIVFFGLTITSSWGNGHASTYRSLIHGLWQRGHQVRFFERNREWYASNRDLPRAEYVHIQTYDDWNEVAAQARQAACDADAIVVGSYAPDAIAALDTVLGHGRARICFYDIDTPITLQALRDQSCTWLRPDQIPALDLYLSFTAGPALDELREHWAAACARPLYCSCNPDVYSPGPPFARPRNDLSYMGTFAPDRQPKLHRLLIEPARRLPRHRFEVAGPLYPDLRSWPANVRNRFHLSPHQHRDFYLDSRLTLNLTRQAMVEYGYSPSVRLFEAGACGVPVLTDAWPGLEQFFTPGHDILVAREASEVVACLLHRSPAELRRMGEAARARVLASHTGARRAEELEQMLAQLDRQPVQHAGNLA